MLALKMMVVGELKSKLENLHAKLVNYLGVESQVAQLPESLFM